MRELPAFIEGYGRVRPYTGVLEFPGNADRASTSGPVADSVSRGLLPIPVVMTIHGGRARGIESGDLHIDVAFLAAPAADRFGNMSGAEGRAACGPLGSEQVIVRRDRSQRAGQSRPRSGRRSGTQAVLCSAE